MKGEHYVCSPCVDVCVCACVFMYMKKKRDYRTVYNQTSEPDQGVINYRGPYHPLGANSKTGATIRNREQ